MKNISPDKISDYFICRFVEMGDPITNMKLQKLLYYTQAKLLTTKNFPHIEEDFEAWSFGPVLPGQYRRFKNFGKNTLVSCLENSDLPCNIKVILDSVIENYGSYNAIDLMHKTHKEDPWKRNAGNSKNNIIPKQEIKEFFEDEIDRESIKQDLLTRYSKAWKVLAE